MKTYINTIKGNQAGEIGALRQNTGGGTLSNGNRKQGWAGKEDKGWGLVGGKGTDVTPAIKTKASSAVG